MPKNFEIGSLLAILHHFEVGESKSEQEYGDTHARCVLLSESSVQNKTVYKHNKNTITSLLFFVVFFLWGGGLQLKSDWKSRVVKPISMFLGVSSPPRAVLTESSSYIQLPVGDCGGLLGDYLF